MGRLMRGHRWAESVLGPPGGWPESLRSTLGLCLDSAFPIAIYWGEQLGLLYNDAWRPILGDKHPWALGRPAREVWPEIWDAIEPAFAQVLSTGKGVFNGDSLLAMNRFGYVEECYFDYTFNPIRSGQQVAGIFNVVIETTYRVIGERRSRAQRDFAARIAPAKSIDEVMSLAATSLAEMAHDVPFALLYRVAAGAGARLAHALGLDPGAEAAPRAVSPDAADRWGLDRVIRGGAVAHLRDLEARFGAPLPGGPWPEPAREALVLPVASSGAAVPAALLVCGVSPRRALDLEYRSFFESLAAHMGRAMSSAEAYETERRRAETLAELDRAKTAFFSNVSHEFRTPLTLMLGPLEDMLEKADPERGEPLRVIHRNGQRLLRLVNTLLDFSRIEAGRAQASFERTDLAALTAELASNFRSACDRAGIALDVDCPPLGEPAYVDREMWEKIVLNLLSNAFKFTLAGEIAVSLEEADGAFRLAVRDTGSGIPAAELPRMFERFHRVEGARGRSHEGSGIGLALVQELVRLHGGTIEVDSTLGKGSTFTVSMPKGRAHLPAERIKAERAGASTALRADAFVEEALSWLPGMDVVQTRAVGAVPRVLLADDNADLREYARRLLAERYEVQAVADGEAALAAARGRRPHLIISDVMMPKLDGFGLVRALRADERLRDVPVLLLSARAGEEARLEGLGKGADDYLVKPFSARELLVRAGALIQSAERVREKQALLAAVIEQMPVGVGLVDTDGRLVLKNDAMSRFVGPVIERADFAARRALRGEVDPGTEYLNRNDDGTQTWTRVAAVPLRDAGGGVSGAICVIQDIDQQRRAADALRESENRLREADRRKDEFIATLSHELRNPLAPLRNALNLLRLSGTPEPGAARLVELMERQVNHLVRLVDDLLEISRITRGAFELRRERVELAAIVGNAVETVEPLIRAGGQRLSVATPEEPLWLDGDPVRLSQILANLLNNAARYTPKGGRIEVQARRDGDRASISVRDDGPGIPADQLGRVFDMFSRGERSTGLGIGLALARRLAQMHGGTVEAKSDGEGRGAEFTVTLPLGSGEGAPAERPRARETAVPPRRVLVVDDNRDAADSLGMLLRHLGAEVEVAHGGREALERFDACPPAIVMLDIGMPEMDGYQVARAIRARASGRAVPLVAVTGWGQEDDRRRAREAGFDHHLVKPAEIETLQALIASLR